MVRDPNVSAEGELELWHRTLRKLPEDNEEERKVKEQLQRYIDTLEHEMSSSKLKNISELEEKYRIKDFPLFVNSCLILGAVILLFFLHSAIHLNLSLAWIAIIGAIAHLVISGVRFVIKKFTFDGAEILKKYLKR
jgi:Na+/H+ antiporter NhaD/arsenite permease-like protein